MLDLRRLAWAEPGPGFDPVTEAERAGTVADWLHNLALYSCADFAGFREEWFWEQFDRCCADNPEFDPFGYKARFDRVLRERDGPRG